MKIWIVAFLAGGLACNGEKDFTRSKSQVYGSKTENQTPDRGLPMMPMNPAPIDTLRPDELAPEAHEPGVISGAFINCSELVDSGAISCVLKDKNERTIHVATDLVQQWEHIAPDGFRSVPRFNVDDNRELGTSYTVTLVDQAPGELRMSVTVAGRVYIFTYSLDYVLPESDDRSDDIDIDNSGDGRGRLVHQASWITLPKGISFLRMLANGIIGDGWDNERDTCLSAQGNSGKGSSSGSATVGRMMSWKLNVEKDTSFSLYMNNVCGLQVGTSVVLIDGPVLKQINLVAGSDAYLQLFENQLLPAGIYTIRVIPGTGDEQMDDFNFSSLIWTIP